MTWPANTVRGAEVRRVRVSELARDVNRRLAPLGRVEVVGEVTGWGRTRRGHVYFCLRDATDGLPVVMFRQDVPPLSGDDVEGQEAVVHGSVSYYAPHERLRLVARSLEVTSAEGRQRLALKRTTRELRERGLLDRPGRAIPDTPAVIGVVAAPGSAALADVQETIARRAPWIRLVLTPARVQGMGAAEEIVRALRTLERRRHVEVILLVRGGGSAQDLWAYNDLRLCEAVATCRVPIISGVGHATDAALCDRCADLRVATPTEAAVRATPDGAAVRSRLMEAHSNVHAAVCRALENALDRTKRAHEATAAALASRTAVVSRRLQQLGPDALEAGVHARLALAGRRAAACSPPALRGRLLGRVDALAERSDAGLAACTTQLHSRGGAVEAAAARLRPEHLRRLLSDRADVVDARLASSDRELREGVSRALDAAARRVDAVRPGELTRDLLRTLEDTRRTLEDVRCTIEALSPAAALARGYAIVRNAAGEVVRTPPAGRPSERLSVEVRDGTFEVQVL